MAIQRVFYERGASQLMISDQEPSFKAVAKDYTNQEAKETIKWLDGWNKSDEKADLEQEYGTEFRFQHAESPELMGLIERMHKTITHSMLSLKQANLRLTQIQTIVKGLQCMLNKRPLCNMDKDQVDEIEFVTLNMLLTGYDLNVCPTFAVPKVGPRFVQSRKDIIRYSKHMNVVYSRTWGKFILTYVENLNIYKRKYFTNRKITEGDYVLYSGLNKEMAPINQYQICRVKQVIFGRDGDNEARSLKVDMIKGGKPKEFTRNVRRFSLLEIEDLKGVPTSN